MENFHTKKFGENLLFYAVVDTMNGFFSSLLYSWHCTGLDDDTRDKDNRYSAYKEEAVFGVNDHEEPEVIALDWVIVFLYYNEQKKTLLL